MNNIPQIVIAIDAMGGDEGCSVIIEGAISASRAKNAKVLLVGNSSTIEEELNNIDTSGASFEIVHASQVVDMTEKPSEIIRSKKDSSIHIACRLVKEGNAEAFVSAGHSGAAVACGMFIVGRMQGVDRPALASIMPGEKNPFVFLDLGATVDCQPSNLLQFALMGDTLAKNFLEYTTPRVALLNIGEEEGKGNVLVREAYDLLNTAQGIHFIGNIEGKDLYTGTADVIVCDGFVGNIALKLSEGVTSSISKMLKHFLEEDFRSKVGGFLAMPAFKRFKKHTDYAEYGGALLLGLKQLGIVAHGRSNAKAIQSATEMAITLAQKKTSEQLRDAIEMNLISIS